MSTLKSSFAKKCEADQKLREFCEKFAEEIRKSSQSEKELDSIDPEGPSSAWGLVGGWL